MLSSDLLHPGRTVSMDLEMQVNLVVVPTEHHFNKVWVYMNTFAVQTSGQLVRLIHLQKHGLNIKDMFS